MKVLRRVSLPATTMRGVAIMISACVAVSFTGCGLLAQAVGESVGIPLESKIIFAKSEPNVLIADDSSTCTVTTAQWEDAEVGRRHLCAWSSGRGSDE